MVYAILGVIILILVGIILLYMARNVRLGNTISYLVQSMKEDRFQRDGSILGDDCVKTCYEDVKLLIHIQPDRENKGIPTKVFDLSRFEEERLISFQYMVPYNYDEFTGFVPHATVCELASGDWVWRSLDDGDFEDAW